MPTILRTLNQMSTVPAEEKVFETWLQSQDAVSFLKDNLQEKEYVVYSSNPHTYIYGVLVPASLVNPPDMEDLMAVSNCTANSSWGICNSFSDPASMSIMPPLGNTGSRTLDQGEQLIYSRNFEGRLGEKGYFEILQKLTHIFDLHFLPERSAYCRLDQNGDIEELVRIEPFKKGIVHDGTAILFNRSLLDEYMALTDSVMVRIFDITRFRPSQFHGWLDAPTRKFTTDGDLFYKLVIEPRHGSYMRGYQIVRPSISKETLTKRFHSSRVEELQYETFLTQDWKTGVVGEISCDPAETATYFVKSTLPFEVSPAFFRSDVLSKYKSDSDKYRLEGHSIACRTGWELKSYDINKAGQVHVYLVDLRKLPYQEQTYWKSFNEPPKGTISKDPYTPPKGTISERAFVRDFEGKWMPLDDPLDNLKHSLDEMNQRRVPWWKIRDESLITKVHYPATAYPDEWLNELQQLDKFLVEGFEGKWLRTKAQSLGRIPDAKLGSLKLTEECLIGLRFEEEHARRIVAPFHEVQELRLFKAHASGKNKLVLRQRQAITEHGSYRNHFRDLCHRCNDSVKMIIKAFG